ncbi:MAG: SdrD B-like domain-containing protein [Gemmataceae bacterium]
MAITSLTNKSVARPARLAAARKPRLGVEILERRDAPAVFTVTTDGASVVTATGPQFEGGMTIAQAIALANKTPGLDTINFSLPPITHSGTVEFDRRTCIIPVAGLPAITDPVIIDGTPNGNTTATNGANNYGISFFSSLVGKSKAGTPGLVIDVGTVNGQTTTIRNLDIRGGAPLPWFYSTAASTTILLGVSGSEPGTAAVITNAGRAIITGNSKAGNGVAAAVFINSAGGNTTATTTYTTHNSIDAKGNPTNLPGYTPNTFISYGDGVTIFNGGNNNGSNIGGINPGENMTIGGLLASNQADGIRIVGTPTNPASFNQIHQSLINNNGQEGVEIIDASNNLVGDPVAPLGGNTIVGNSRDGIFIHSTTSSALAFSNRVQGNTIGGLGTNFNGQNGVLIDSAPNTLIGGTQSLAGNIIGGNSSSGVQVVNKVVPAATGVIIQQNVIGGVANGFDGILIGDQLNPAFGAPGVLIGGNNTASNIITGNTRIGIEVKGPSPNTQIINNTIDNNVREGILVDGANGATGTTIGGTTTAVTNTINGNGFEGVLLQNNADNSFIQGNTINNNTREGITISASKNILIGGPQGPAGNAIAGDRNGVIIQNGSSNIVFNNNKIGSIAGGNPNSGDGILIDNSTGIQIGQAVGNGGNFIGGNRNGVNVTNGSTNVTVFNNKIGTDNAGGTFTNTQNGVLLDNIANVTVGGSLSQQRNVISGSTGAGILLSGAVTNNTVIRDNLIGTDSTGTKAIPNTHGIWINNGSTNNTIGGAALNQGNIISGNLQNGVRIENFGNNNIIQGNFIGTDVSGTNALGNGATGVYIDSSSGNLIGGPAPITTTSNQGNIIANSGKNGITLLDTLNSFTANGNTFEQNKIFNNGQLGIDLGSDLGQVTLNDTQPHATGPNHYTDFPVITSAEVGSIVTQVKGTLNDFANNTANGGYRVEFFANPAPNPNGSPPGYGQGQTYLGSLTTTNGAFTFTSITAITVGSWISATATNLATGDTSEFALSKQATIAQGVISGQKFNDLNGDGIKEAGEPGVPGWEIDLDYNNDGTIDAKATTDASGNYSFIQLTDGIYRLSEVPQSGWVQTRQPAPNPLQITGELTIPNQDFGNFKLMSISGHKFQDNNGNGIQDANDGPLKDVVIELYQLVGPSQTKVFIESQPTDLSGNYIFRNVGPTAPFTFTQGVPLQFQLDEIVPSGFTPTTPNPRPPFFITSGTNVTGQDFGNKPGGGGIGGPPGVGGYVVGADAGGSPNVRMFNADGTQRLNFFAYGISFTGGVRVAKGDITGDLTPDVITGAGPGGGPHVEVFDGNTGKLIRSFFAFDSGFTGGVYVGSADVNHDGIADIIVGAGAGGGPHVKVFDGRSGIELFSFFAYNAAFTGGVRVAGGDVNGDGLGDIIVGAGPGGGPHVQVYDGSTFGQPVLPTQIRSFFAYDPSFTGGIFVAAGKLNADNLADIITGPDKGGGPEVKGFDGASGNLLLDFGAFANLTGGGGLFTGDTNFSVGTRVAVADVNQDGIDDIVVAPGHGQQPHLQIYNGRDTTLLRDTMAFDPGFLGGVFVG